MDAREKLLMEESELLESVEESYKDIMKKQFDMVFDELIKKAEEDVDFAGKVLLYYKSFSRCMKYVSEKAMGMRKPTDEEKKRARNHEAPIVTPVTSDIFFGWVYEYYDLDDKEEFDKSTNKQCTKEQDTKPIKKTGKTRNRELDGQLSLFA